MSSLRQLFQFTAIVALLGCSNESGDLPWASESQRSRDVEIHYVNNDPSAEWTKNSIALDSPEIDIYFLLHDGSNFHDEHDATFFLPDILRKFKNKVSTSEVSGNEHKLVEYYEQIISAASQYRLEFREISHLFWLRLIIHDQDGTELFNFLYSDTLDKITGFEEWVGLNNEQHVFSDLDQGWAIEARVREGLVYLLESDPDNGIRWANHSIPQEYLNSALKISVENARDIIITLSESLGEDVWTTNRGYPWDRVNF